MQSYSDFLRSRMDHEYTAEEIDVLYSVIEEAAEIRQAIDIHKIERFLRPGDLRQIGFGNNAAYDILFEIKGLRWKYDGQIYRALIAPRARHGQVPGVEWYVPITVCEDDGTSWSRTHMLRKEYRCRPFKFSAKESHKRGRLRGVADETLPGNDGGPRS